MSHAHALAISVNFGSGVQNLVNTIAHAIPKIAVFLLILVVGVFVAWLVGRLIGKGLQQVGFNRFAERGAVGQALSRGRWDASTLVGKVVYYMILLFVLQMAFGVFGPNPISVLLSAVVAWLPKAIVAIAIVIAASAIAKVVKDVIANAIGGLSYGPFLASAASAVILVLGVIAALNQADIATTVTEPVLIAGLATVAAIVAIGVGGGLVRPMQARWERMLDSAERETTAQVAAYQRGRQDATARTRSQAGQTSPERHPSAVGQGSPRRGTRGQPGSGRSEMGGPGTGVGPGAGDPGSGGFDPGSDPTRPNPDQP
jgi:Conserved TM helix